MKIAFLVALMTVATATCVCAQEVTERKYYDYRITGIVTDELGGPANGMYVCWIPQERPIQGRIPCTNTDEKGRYDLAVSDVPDKYVISASSYQGFLLGDGKSPGKAYVGENGEIDLKEIKEYRSAGSGILIFGPAEESRSIDMRLILYRWSEKARKYLAVQSEPHGRVR